VSISSQFDPTSCDLAFDFEIVIPTGSFAQQLLEGG
jgi:hypothetical protein